jgi:hypothetical protein
MCETAYLTILLSMWGSTIPLRWKSRDCSVVDASRRDKIRDTNFVKSLRFLKREESNVRTERCFQIFFHLVDSMQVWTALSVSTKESMWSKRKSGKLLSRSSFTLLLYFCLLRFIISELRWFICAIDHLPNRQTGYVLLCF